MGAYKCGSFPKFSWDGTGHCMQDIAGECTRGRGFISEASRNDKAHYTGPVESPFAGAAYIFERKCIAPANIDNMSSCVWSEKKRLVASDNRNGNLFGYSVDINGKEGITVVGSMQSSAFGVYQEDPSVYPYKNSTSIKFPLPSNLEQYVKAGETYSPTRGNLRLVDYILKTRIDSESIYTNPMNQKAGSVYLYSRVPSELDDSGEVLREEYWKSSEDAKFAPPDVSAGDAFGTSISFDGSTALIGSTGDDACCGTNGGASYLYDLRWYIVYFTLDEFVALEGTDREVLIFVRRNILYLDDVLAIGYSTSDLTATGVDSTKFAECLTIPLEKRDGCGDYEQTSGELTFAKGQHTTYFNIKIMNDLCWERHMEYIQLNLHIPGGGPINGKLFRAQLRIDDDDWSGLSNSINCTGGIF